MFNYVGKIRIFLPLTADLDSFYQHIEMLKN